jgi:AraC family transcriptional regulator
MGKMVVQFRNSTFRICDAAQVNVMPISESRIEVYENGQRVPFAYRPPALTASLFQSDDAVLERYVKQEPADYRERQMATGLLFLFEDEATQVTARTEKQRFHGQICSGDMWLIPAFVLHSAIFPEVHGVVALSMGSLALERHVGPLMHGGRMEFAPQLSLKDTQLEHLVRGLVGVAEEGPQADPLIAELLLHATCLRLAKRYAVSKLNLAPRTGGLPPMRLKRVLSYVEANLDTAITLSQLSGVADMSLYYFATLFKQSTSLTPHQYVLRRRIERAKELLRETKAGVLEISLSVGFEQPTNFSRTFRRLTGTSPTHYRRNFF